MLPSGRAAVQAFGLRDSCRGLVGSNVGEFNTRLLHVGLAACGLAAFCKFD